MQDQAARRMWRIEGGDCRWRPSHELPWLSPARAPAPSLLRPGRKGEEGQRADPNLLGEGVGLPLGILLALSGCPDADFSLLVDPEAEPFGWVDRSQRSQVSVVPEICADVLFSLSQVSVVPVICAEEFCRPLVLWDLFFRFPICASISLRRVIRIWKPGCAGVLLRAQPRWIALLEPGARQAPPSLQ